MEYVITLALALIVGYVLSLPAFEREQLEPSQSEANTLPQSDSLYVELEDLYLDHQAGKLTDDEFELQKMQLKEALKSLEQD